VLLGKVIIAKPALIRGINFNPIAVMLTKSPNKLKGLLGGRGWWLYRGRGFGGPSLLKTLYG